MIQQTPAPAPAAPAIPIVVGDRNATPSEIYNAFRNQRRELRQQQSDLEDKRGDLRRELTQTGSSDPLRKGLEQRLSDVDQQISALDKQIASADAAVARAAAVPGAVVPSTPIPRRGPPDGFWVVSVAMVFFVLFPVAIGYARRLWRRGAAVVASLPAELSERLTRIEQAVDAIAIEVERVGESQRYVTSVITGESGPRALAAGAAEPIAVHARELAPNVRR